MSWYRKQPTTEWKAPPQGILTEFNAALGKFRYTVQAYGHNAMPFDTYEEALAHYHDLTGWVRVKRETP